MLTSRCLSTCDGPADGVQVCDLWVGGVDLEEVLLHLTVGVVSKLQRHGDGEEKEGGEKVHHCCDKSKETKTPVFICST